MTQGEALMAGLHRTRLLALALGTALASLAAAPTFAQTKTVISGGFDVGPGGFQGNFNPMSASAGFTWLSTYYEPLIVYDAKLEKIAPALATSWQVSPDKLTYTFKLAADAKWHDGKPFTSADVKFTLGLAKDAKSGSVFGARLNAVKDVETPDAQTAVIKLSAPNAGLMDTLTKLMMLPAHQLSAIPVDALAKHEWWSKTPVGTGPFKWVKYETDQYVELAANADYRGGKPKVDGLVNRYFKTTATAAAALKSGEIQVSYVEADDAKTFAGNNAFRVVEGDSYVVNYLGFNGDAPLWKDERVRKAVLYAIDRNAIIASLFGGAAKPANCGYVADHLVPSGIEPYAYSPDKAKALLKEAGYGPGGKKMTVEIRYNTSENHKNTSVAMANQWKPFNVEVKLVNTDLKTHYALLRDKGDFDVARAGWIADYSDPQNFLFLGESDNKGLNYANYANKDYDALMKKAAGTKDLTERAKVLKQAEAIFVNDQAYIPLMFYGSKNLVSDKVSGYESNTLDRHLSRFLSIKN